MNTLLPIVMVIVPSEDTSMPILLCALGDFAHFIARR
jgi:hypothetical protein